ncbi:MAG: methylated-DNA--[protein]-cysteine S-methyltransferase [Alphaproteobacteria bacterium]|nr:methylated-DNA--[protein]-cysteine S-methyltransferase [Alphaproteobacteria bacterium]
MSDASICYAYYDSPVGRLLLAGDEQALTLISFPAGSRARGPDPGWRRDDAMFAAAVRELEEYFAGDRLEFSVPLQLSGTEFQNAYWTLLQTVRLGETTTYGALAQRIGRPKASRAVGAANGANPIPIIIPCHRVIGSNKSLTGFGGGIETKRYLLDHESRIAANKGS